ncbi:MAG: nucleotidyltransferase substrate binding protein [Pseudomonas sp.]|uniref:nucleotidyltransferase substrate binding protein n=1 Tax=Pseudomonas sp. TaxID=306 RepID=UPI003919AC4D
MNSIRQRQRFDNFRPALRQLTDVATLRHSRPPSWFERQGLIKAFEFTHELVWNVLKDDLEYEGITGLVGSRSTVREAFKRGLIEDGEVWMDMIDKRNLSSHTYNKALAQAVVEAVDQRYLPAFMALQRRLAELA